MPVNTPLNVMVLESDRGGADRAVRDLAAAGHVVLRCHDAGAPAFPCRGLDDRSTCPLRSHAVDVALTVRSRPRSQPTAEEVGARCALMERVPLVVAGPAVLDPFESYEARVVDDPDHVVRACEEVAAGELARHAAIATDALRASRSPNPVLAGARASVTRRGGRLVLSVTGLEPLAPRQRDAAIVRTMAKLREFDSAARGIDVLCPGREQPFGHS